MVSGNPLPLEKPESVGMLFPGLKGKIVDDELWLSGNNLMLGYYNNDDENKKSLFDEWFKTGDLARFDEDGYLYITGRIKDLIVLSNGENVSPAYIESKMNEFACIQDSLVYEKDGRLFLEVLLRRDEVGKLGESEDKIVREIIEKVNGELEEFEKISEFLIRNEDFERSPSMKIVRPRK